MMSSFPLFCSLFFVKTWCRLPFLFLASRTGRWRGNVSETSMLTVHGSSLAHCLRWRRAEISATWVSPRSWFVNVVNVSSVHSFCVPFYRHVLGPARDSSPTGPGRLQVQQTRRACVEFCVARGRASSPDRGPVSSEAIKLVFHSDAGFYSFHQLIPILFCL